MVNFPLIKRWWPWRRQQRDVLAPNLLSQPPLQRSCQSPSLRRSCGGLRPPRAGPNAIRPAGSTLQNATAAAIAANVPLWLPAGTYVLNRELVIDYAPLAATGFQIISDGAVIDARATGQRAVSVECSGGAPD